MSEAAAAPAAPLDTSAAAAAVAAPAEGDQNTQAPAPLNVDPPAPPVVPDVDETVVVEYNKTGDPALDLALGFVGRLGFGPERPEIVAAQKGDFKPLEESLKKLGDKAKGYEQYLTVAQDSYKRVTEARKAKEDAAQAAVVSAVGGAAQWNAIHAWVVANASDEQKASINAAFKGGEYSAVAMARQLSDLFKQSGQSTAKPKSVVKEAAASEPAAAGALSPAQFKDELKKLHAKYGVRLDTKPEYKDLVARRRAYTA